MRPTTTLTKKELRQHLNISQQTLARLLNDTYYQELSCLGYTKKQRILLPRQLKLIDEIVGLEI